MPPPVTGLIVDLLGFLTGAVLYVMLVAMVWRERASEGRSFLSRRGRLPLLTGLCGLVWNVGALATFGFQVTGRPPAPTVMLAVAFSALGFLPAVVVHSLLEGRETTTARRFIRPAIAVAYLLSASAALMQVYATFNRGPVPSRPALWLLTSGFVALTASLLVVTRDQPIGRRGVWIAALSIFAVSALHFGRHVGNESWWVELIGHHASLPLALAILYQGYRFALADLFLKNAIALLMLMAVCLAVFSGAMLPLLRWQDPGGVWDPRAVALVVALWMATALTFPLLRRLSVQFVDRAVLRRPDYDVILSQLARHLESAKDETAAILQVAAAVRDGLGVLQVATIDDPLPDVNRPLVVTGPELRNWRTDPACVLLIRLRTVDPPHPALSLGQPVAGRRLLSAEVRLLEEVARLAARRIDALRVAEERESHALREQAMQRLATEAELRALRAQLNPHFLFNALTTIGYLIQNAPPRALDTLLRLTRLLRSVLRRSTTEFCTLAEEIDLVRTYLEIEHARFEERLEVAIDVAPAVQDLIVPALLLQPVVENAVKHGIAPSPSGGLVRIAAHVRDHMLHIAVEDSGIGFDTGFGRTGSGVGLRSVAERIRAHYGDEATLHIRSTRGYGTEVEIDLPAETQPSTRRLVG